MRSRPSRILIPSLFMALAFPLVMQAQSSHSRVMVTQPIDQNVLHRLAGNTRSQANAQNDAGPVADGLAMDHMLLQLQRPAEQEAAVRQLIESQQDPHSPNYHQWLTAEEIGASFGPAQEDIDAVSGWLQSQGFQVNSVYPSGMLIDFSGTAGQVRGAFHTEIHRLTVNGSEHIGNMSDPMIPAALAPVVAGIVSLHDFTPRTLNKPRANYTFTSGSSTEEAVAPADLAKIYNLSSLFTASTAITGKGQTIVVVEDSDMYSSADWTTFRSTFGLSNYTSGSLTTVHPAPATGTNNCLDPGVNSDDVETELDAEWASAAAPNAAIQVATCANTRTTFGGLIAVQNLLTLKTPPSDRKHELWRVRSREWRHRQSRLRLQYLPAGGGRGHVSVFVAAGDEGAASCDAGAIGSDARNRHQRLRRPHRITSPWAAPISPTPIWAPTALIGVPPTGRRTARPCRISRRFRGTIPAPDRCSPNTWDIAPGMDRAVCAAAQRRKRGRLADSRGRQRRTERMRSGSPSQSGMVGGTCAATPSRRGKPTGPSDGVRDIPDVSLFASNGLWGHYYVICYSDRRNGGSSCAGAPGTWAGAGGTSFASPIMAGIQALVNQKIGGTTGQGNPAPVYYSLAAGTYGSMIFNSVTMGDNTVNCSGTVDCYGSTASSSSSGHGRFNNSPPSANGELSTSSNSPSPAYSAGPGLEFCNRNWQCERVQSGAVLGHPSVIDSGRRKEIVLPPGVPRPGGYSGSSCSPK
jgi:hypothetical protein